MAKIVAELGLDDVTIAGALLHDAVEDTGMTIADVETDFGAEVAAIVDGVTKLDRLKFDSKEAQQAATMRKMLVAMAKDLRVLIIKLADRLHNMRTIAAMPAWKQERTAQETLDIYAPLAHRLGMQEMKQQLEDLAFAALHPKRYAEIDHMVATRCTRTRHLPHPGPRGGARAARGAAHRRRGHRAAEAPAGRIYEKMVVKGREFDDIYDLVGIRVIVDSVKDCYAALGLDPRHLEAGAGPVQGLHRHAQVQPLPVAAHHGGRPAGQAARGADPHP